MALVTLATYVTAHCPPEHLTVTRLIKTFLVLMKPTSSTCPRRQAFIQS